MIETVGVGQSETDVAEAADTVAVVVQPGSGDALQFLKAGIMEIPDVLVVTKADLGAVANARRARSEGGARRARRHAGRRCSRCPRSRRPTASTRWPTRSPPTANALDLDATRTRARRLGALADFLHEHGERGLRALGGRRAARRWLEEQPAELDEPELLRRLEDGPRRNHPRSSE